MGKANIVLVGAGSAVFGVRLVHDLVNTEGLVGSKLTLVDIDDERLNLVYNLGKRLITETNADIELHKSNDYNECLDGADFVISTVARGGTEAWLQDVIIPRKYGYNYMVGDTMGPGGLFRSLRTIPVTLDLAKAMEVHCPDALLINYSNPMTAICRAVNKYTDINVIGLCHGLKNTIRRISPRLGYDPDDVGAFASGINHFIWLTDLYQKSNGKDLYPELFKHSREFPEEQPIAYDLLNTYGLLPSGGDDHIVEFITYYATEKSNFGRDYNLELDYVKKEVEYQKEEIAELKDLLDDDEQSINKSITGNSESAAEIIDCIVNRKTNYFMVNVPNNGKIPGLPDEAVVEVPGITTPSGIRGLQVEPLPTGITGRLLSCINEFELYVETAVNFSRNTALQAILINPLTRVKDEAEEMLAELLEVNEQYLG